MYGGYYNLVKLLIDKNLMIDITSEMITITHDADYFTVIKNILWCDDLNTIIDLIASHQSQIDYIQKAILIYMIQCRDLPEITKFMEQQHLNFNDWFTELFPIIIKYDKIALLNQLDHDFVVSHLLQIKEIAMHANALDCLLYAINLGLPFDAEVQERMIQLFVRFHGELCNKDPFHIIQIL